MTAASDVVATAAEPPQLLGPGWRHSLDVRLLLEIDDVTGDVTSVVLRSPDTFIRMHLLVNDPVSPLYGRNATRDVIAEEFAGEWTVKLEDGTELVFDESVNDTDVHPLVPEIPEVGVLAGTQHLRIREI